MQAEEARRILDALAEKVINAVPVDRLVIGLSGGADSTLVLLLAVRIRELCPECQVQAVHCIHGLDADDPVWLDHCTRLCQRVKVDLVTPRLHIVYGGGRSPEEVSRAERYAALLDNLKGGVLMLGHQADDEVESFLLALKRGSGPRGLSGMHFLIRDERGTIVRPLLELHKKQIEEIIQALGFDFVYDISNSYLKFERNFIRLKVLPLLKNRFPGIDGSILRSQKLCGQEHELAERYTRIFYEEALTPRGLDIAKLDLTDETLLTSVLRMFINTHTSLPVEYSCIQQAIALCRTDNDQHGLVKISDKYHLRRYRSLLCVVPVCRAPEKQVYELRLGQKLKLGDVCYSLEETDDLKKGFKVADRVLLDFNLKGQMRLKPAARAHSRELKKLFGEFSVPVWDRDFECLVLNDRQEILALGDLFVQKQAELSSAGEDRLYCLKIEKTVSKSA